MIEEKVDMGIWPPDAWEIRDDGFAENSLTKAHQAAKVWNEALPLPRPVTVGN